MMTAQDIAQKKYHLRIKIVPFTDYSLPNRAWRTEISISICFSISFFRGDMKAHGYHLKVVGKSFIYPMACIPRKLNPLKKVLMVLLSVCPMIRNEGRALLLIQKAGFIKLNQKPVFWPHPKTLSTILNIFRLKNLMQHC